MNVLIPLLIGTGLLFLATKTYAFYVSRKMGVDTDLPTPATRLNDGQDYVPTPTHVVFGHHFATIAGAGPIVGPALALAYGWGLPWLWIVLGCIFFGAVHDMSGMFLSMREDGRSIADICRRCLGGTGYVFFVAFLILMLTLVNATFLNLSCQALSASYPAELLKIEAGQTFLNTYVDKDGIEMGRIGGIATTSVFIITLFAPLLGWMIHKRHLKTWIAYIVAGVVCVASIVIGFMVPVVFSQDAATTETVWRWVMSAYIFIACWLPVWLVLQPRDFVNVQILYAGVIVMLGGLFMLGIKGQTIPQDMFFAADAGAFAGPIWPFLFITVACGAISGFHSLAVTGTTAKQITSESDVRRVGYNGMILEGVLALVALLVIAVALPRAEYMNIVYPAAKNGNPILAFSVSIGYMLHNVTGLPIALGAVLGILILEGFVVTTLDTAVRLCRYMIEELWSFVFCGKQPAIFKNSFFNTLVAIALMLFFAMNSTILSVWKIFGAGNQLIAALAMTVATVWLLVKGRSFWYTLVPALVMIVTSYASLLISIRKYLAPSGSGRFVVEGKGVLMTGACLLLVLATGVLVVAFRKFGQHHFSVGDKPEGREPPMPVEGV